MRLVCGEAAPGSSAVTLGDTVFAVASPPGPAPRGIVRISGPAAFAAGSAVLDVPVPRARAALERRASVLGFPVEVLVLAMPGPGSYTGEDVVELHTSGSPLLLGELLAQLRALQSSGVRDAVPGEFTRRAYEAGRLDLAAAEAVQALISAGGEAERRWAVDVLRGGLAAAVDAVRAGIQDAQALLEAALDFTADETGAVDAELWRPQITAARSAVTRLRASVPAAEAGGALLLAGAANAGKSSLANALAGREAVLVSAQAGTTRDVVAVEIAPDVVLLDAPGDVLLEDLADDEDRRALALRDAVAGQAAAAIWVVDSTAPCRPTTILPAAAIVWTKQDLVGAPGAQPEAEPWAAAAGGVPGFRVSSRNGTGIGALGAFVARRARHGAGIGLRRVGDHLQRAAQALDAAAAGAASGLGEELIALELGQALVELDAIAGRSSPEDLLDRIFGAFCLGK